MDTRAARAARAALALSSVTLHTQNSVQHGWDYIGHMGPHGVAFESCRRLGPQADGLH